MFFDKKVIKRSDWHYKLHTWYFGEEYQGYNFCPYFWLLMFCVLTSPFAALVKLSIGTLKLIVKGFDSISEKIAAKSLNTKVDEFLTKVGYVDLENTHSAHRYLDRVGDYKFQDAVGEKIGQFSSSLLVILNYKAKQVGIKMLKDDTPQHVKEGRVYDLQDVAPYFTEEYLAWVDVERKERIRIATIQAEENRISEAKAEIWDARFEAVYSVIGSIWSNTFGRIPTPTKTDLIMGTKKVVGWLMGLGVVAITLGAAYGLFLSYGWIIANIVNIGLALLLLGVLALGAIGLVGLVKITVEYLRTVDFSWVENWKVPTWLGYFKYLGYPVYLPIKWLVKLAKNIGQVCLFFRDGFMSFKADNCPELEIID